MKIKFEEWLKERYNLGKLAENKENENRSNRFFTIAIIVSSLLMIAHLVLFAICDSFTGGHEYFNVWSGPSRGVYGWELDLMSSLRWIMRLITVLLIGQAVLLLRVVVAMEESVDKKLLENNQAHKKGVMAGGTTVVCIIVSVIGNVLLTLWTWFA